MFACAAAVVVVVVVVVVVLLLGAQIVELDAGLGAESHGGAGVARVAVGVLEPGAVGVGGVAAAAAGIVRVVVRVGGGAE